MADKEGAEVNRSVFGLVGNAVKRNPLYAWQTHAYRGFLLAAMRCLLMSFLQGEVHA